VLRVLIEWLKNTKCLQICIYSSSSNYSINDCSCTRLLLIIVRPTVLLTSFVFPDILVGKFVIQAINLPAYFWLPITILSPGHQRCKIVFCVIIRRNSTISAAHRQKAKKKSLQLAYILFPISFFQLKCKHALVSHSVAWMPTQLLRLCTSKQLIQLCELVLLHEQGQANNYLMPTIRNECVYLSVLMSIEKLRLRYDGRFSIYGL
jgi:hypothetical protein